MSDFRYALRSLLKSPGFTAVAVLTLALGIGLGTTIFTGVNPLLFRALPFHDPDRLVYLNESSPSQGFARMSVAYADYLHWRADNHVFSDIAAWRGANVALSGDGNPEHVEACRASASLFTTLGLQPAIGRDFLSSEDQPGAAPVVLIGDGLWQRRFGGRREIVGQSILLNGTAYTVIGIMPPRVRFPNDADLWIPLVIDRPETTHGNFNQRVAARLKPGATLAQAQSDLAIIQERIGRESPKSNSQVGVVVRSLEEAFIDGELRSMGWTMLGAVVFVVAVACANVAGLFVTRALGRHHEFAIRTALGAGRWQIIRQLLIESLVIGALAGIAGVLFAVWGANLVIGLVPIEIPYWIDFSMDSRVIGFAIGMSLVTSLAFGLAPAWQASRVSVAAGLNELSRTGSDGRERQRLRRLFVVAEIALAMLLLCGTGSMLRSLLNLQQVNPGFDPSRVLAFYLDMSSSASTTNQSRTAFYSTLIERLRSTPGVTHAAACSSLPLSGSDNTQVFVVEGEPLPLSGAPPVGTLRVVTPGYFATMRIPLITGRDFSSADSATSPKVIIIEAALARKFFGTADPIGRRIRWNSDDPSTSREIVAVVGDVKHSTLETESRPGFYVPYAQNPVRLMGVVVRTAAAEPTGVLAMVKDTLRSIDPGLPLFGVRSLRAMIGETYWIRRYLSRLLVGFAVLALALAAVGIASVVAYAVAQRTREIGIRMALGAGPGDALRMILAEGLRLATVGLAIGLVGSIGLTQLLASQLYAIGWLDPASLAVAVIVFGSVALVACWLPARKATLINPVEALRAE